MVGYKGFTLIPNDWLTDEAWVIARLPRSKKLRLLSRLLGAVGGFSGNVGEHSLECCASGRIGVFLRPIPSAGLFVLSGGFGVGCFHFLRNHHSAIRIYEWHWVTESGKSKIATCVRLRNTAFTWFWYDERRRH